MTIKCFVCLFLLSLSCTLMAKELKIIVNVPFITPVGDQIYITGNNPPLCHWKVNCKRLEKMGETVWQTVITLPDDLEELEFKITRGSWKFEEVTSSGRVPENHILKIEKDQSTYVHNVPHWKDLPKLDFTGNSKVIKNFHVPELSNFKDIYIWLPPSYALNKEKKYPIIYMHDGQNVFSPQNAAFGNEWSVDEVMAKLIREGKVPEAIIVAPSSDPFERSLEYNVYEKGRLYADFLVKTLKPHIDRNYRTKTDRSNTFLMGSSYGALISFTILWEHSNTFSKAAGLSFPAFAHDNQIFKFIDETPAPVERVDFYMDHGLFGIDARYAPSGENWVDHLLGLGFPGDQLEFKTFEYANHTELDWAQRVHIPLIYLLR